MEQEAKEMCREIGLSDVISGSGVMDKGAVVIYVQGERNGEFFSRFYRVR